MSEISEVTTVLLASPHAEDHAAIRGILHGCRWEVFSARTPGETFRVLDRIPIDVILSTDRFPGGPTWRDLVDELRERPNPQPVVVASHLADDNLWAEVLNLGCYDLLLRPFDALETQRTLSLAGCRSRLRRASLAVA